MWGHWCDGVLVHWHTDELAWVWEHALAHWGQTCGCRVTHMGVHQCVLGMWGVYQLALVHGHQCACWCTGIRCILAHWHWHMGVGVHSIDWTRYLLSVMSSLDPHGTHNADSDRCLKQSRLVRTIGSDERIEVGIHLDVDKHAGGP
jgi:hypothetical protein